MSGSRWFHVIAPLILAHLAILIVPRPADGASCVPDPFEQNEGCGNAYFLVPGSYPDLTVESADEDWYAISLVGGGQLTIDVLFTHAEGNIDIELRGLCTDGALAASTSLDDDEQIIFINTSGTSHVYKLLVRLISGVCNEYTLNIANSVTSNLSVLTTPAGWSSSIVPRASGDADSLAAILPAELIGDEDSTWVNWHVDQQGPEMLSGWSAQLLLDGETVLDSVRFAGPTPPGDYLFLNRGPFHLSGGRHTFWARVDPYEEIPETNETDNIWFRQWVWRPPDIYLNQYQLRGDPPLAGETLYPNSDGFRYIHDPDNAFVVATASLAANYLEGYVYSDYNGSQSGFSDVEADYESGAIRYVLGHTPGIRDTVYPAVTRRYPWEEPGQYLIEARDSQGRIWGETGSFLGETLGPNQLTGVYQGDFVRGKTYSILLSRLSGAGRLVFRVSHISTLDYWPDWYGKHSEQGGTHLDSLIFVPYRTGAHAIVVQRWSVEGIDTPSDYDLVWYPWDLIDAPAGSPSLSFEFHGAAPNPMRQSTQLSFTVAERGPVVLSLFDLRGGRVCTPMNETLEPGPHSVEWDGRDEEGDRVPAGIYWAQLRAGGSTIVKRVAVLR